MDARAARSRSAEGGRHAPVVPGHAPVPLPGLPGSILDAGSRGRWADDLQKTAGNRAASELMALQREEDPSTAGSSGGDGEGVVSTPGGGARRQLDANPYSGEDDPVELANARFSGQPRLARIAMGKGSLSAADNGPAVKAVQQALIDVGYEMFRHGADGQFGSETREAIAAFRDRRGMPGDTLTAKALGELDQAAPPPGTQEQHLFDFERLFADGFLDITLGIGYDEGKTHDTSLANARAGLADRGFTAAEPAAGKPEQFSLTRSLTYPTKSGDRLTRDVTVRVSVIAPGEGAAEQFGAGLADSELAIYSGHARRGIGPDFDDARSAKENFVMGVSSALHAAGKAVSPTQVEQSHYVIDKINDLEEMTRSGRFDQEKYRIWFMGACSSIAFFEELRGGILPPGMDRSNLDLLGTAHAMPLDAGIPATFALIDGILASKSIEQITVAMNEAGEEGVKAIPDSEVTPAQRQELMDFTKGLSIHEGAGDNAIAPAPAQ
jgi:peptidoglycan hydrolase-like protein with peptidoglycan-binding domain